MIDYNKLRQKFPIKNAAKKKKAAAIKAIAREYELKRAELGAGAPSLRRGIPYYMAVLLGLMLLGALVIPQILSNGADAFDGRAQKRLEQAKANVQALAIALGRYRYHTGYYPSTELGLAQLALKRALVDGWNGPYIRQLRPDPWKRDYVYVYNGEAENPTLYSKGPDGIAGTTDDVIADPTDFDAAFRDTSWTNGWMPQHLRGYVVVQNERHREQIESELAEIRARNAAAADPLNQVVEGSVSVRALKITETTADMRLTYATGRGAVTNDFTLERPIFWTPSRPFCHHTLVQGREIAFPVRTLVFQGDGSVVLNGETLALRGVDVPREALCLAGGYRREAAARLLSALKDMGANAVRLTGDGADEPAFDDLCDTYGFLRRPSDGPSFDCPLASVLDACGEPTVAFRERQAQWNPPVGAPQLVLASGAWSGTEGAVQTVRCLTSGDEAELFVNGVSQGRRKGGFDELVWQVPYEDGGVKAIVYQSGRYVGEVEAKTPGRAFALTVQSDATRLGEGEIAFLTIEAQDEDGTFVPQAENALTLRVSGPGERVDATPVALQQGRALVAIRRTGGSGLPLVVSVSAKGLRPTNLRILKR